MPVSVIIRGNGTRQHGLRSSTPAPRKRCSERSGLALIDLLAAGRRGSTYWSAVSTAGNAVRALMARRSVIILVGRYGLSIIVEYKATHSENAAAAAW